MEETPYLIASLQPVAEGEGDTRQTEPTKAITEGLVVVPSMLSRATGRERLDLQGKDMTGGTGITTLTTWVAVVAVPGALGRTEPQVRRVTEAHILTHLLVVQMLSMLAAAGEQEAEQHKGLAAAEEEPTLALLQQQTRAAVVGRVTHESLLHRAQAAPASSL